MNNFLPLDCAYSNNIPYHCFGVCLICPENREALWINKNASMFVAVIQNGDKGKYLTILCISYLRGNTTSSAHIIPRDFEEIANMLLILWKNVQSTMHNNFLLKGILKIPSVLLQTCCKIKLLLKNISVILNKTEVFVPYS